MTRPRHRLQLIAINLGVFLCLVILAEIAWRLTHGEPSEVPFVESSLAYLEPCASIERRTSGAWIVGREQLERTAFEMPLRKPPGVLRIAVVGESSGSMLAYKMGELLRQSSGSERLQVISCAAPGSALEHVERRARETLGYQPDVLVVVFGHNIDFQYPMDERELRLLSWRNHSRLLSGLSTWLLPAAPEQRAPFSQRLQQFEMWLRDLSNATRQQGIQLVLTTMTPNLWAPPRATGEALTNARLLAARFDYAAGKQASAIDSLSRLVQDSDQAIWHFWLGTWLARAGATSAARDHLRRALDADGGTLDPNAAPVGRDRAPTVVNDIVRRVATDAHVPLRDTEREMERRAHDGLPGWDVMQDHCHLQAAIVLQEAATVFELAQETTGVPQATRVRPSPPASATKPGLAKILELTTASPRSGSSVLLGVALAVERWLRDDLAASRDAIETFVSRRAYTAALGIDGPGTVLAGIAEGYWATGHTDEALAVNTLARQQPGPEPWIQLGLFCVQRGDSAGARQAFEQAVAIDSTRADAVFFLQRLDAGASPP
jgi:tetratricopeptide (TPR) repeat protein